MKLLISIIAWAIFMSIFYLAGAFVTMDLHWASWETIKLWNQADRGIFISISAMLGSLSALAILSFWEFRE